MNSKAEAEGCKEMTNEEKEKRKQNHGKGMRLLAALTIEHGLRLLSPDDEARSAIEGDIAIVRSGGESEIRSRYLAAKRRKVSYTPAGLLLQGSTAMLDLGKSRGHVPDGLLRAVIYFPGEAAFLIDGERGRSSGERRAEWDWQEAVIHPLRDRLFEDYGGETLPTEIEQLTVKKETQ
jgi:hypothetical protein